MWLFVAPSSSHAGKVPRFCIKASSYCTSDSAKYFPQLAHPGRPVMALPNQELWTQKLRSAQVEFLPQCFTQKRFLWKRQMRLLFDKTTSSMCSNSIQPHKIQTLMIVIEVSVCYDWMTVQAILARTRSRALRLTLRIAEIACFVSDCWVLKRWATCTSAASSSWEGQDLFNCE